MEKHFTLSLLLMVLPVTLFSQTDYFANPSFEGETGIGNLPDGWTVCRSTSTPDLQPVDIRLSASDGQSFAGLIMRDDPEPKSEEMITGLRHTLFRDSAYILSIDLASVPYLKDQYVQYNKVPQLRISGGAYQCTNTEVLAISEPVADTMWSRHCFVISPRNSDINFLTLEIYAEQLQSAYLVLDNMHLEPFKISGARQVCQGSRNVMYQIPWVECASAINASYTGTGSTINYANNRIIMSFADDATDGDLVVRYLTEGGGADSIMFPITVDSGMPAGGSINGDTEVCQGQTLEYYQTDVSNTTIYNWIYTGTGATFNSYGQDITVDYATDATSGSLILVPENGCGRASAISLDIEVIPLPADAGLISGENEVCTGQTQNFHIPGITYATNYIWSYSGEGVGINNLNLDAQLTFLTGATGGYLSVTGVNSCGQGKKSLDFIIFMKKPPGGAQAIDGVQQICRNQSGLKYRTSAIQNVTQYQWIFSGRGATINGNTNEVEIDFSPDATPGTLTVAGQNACGTGNPSPQYLITVDSVPRAPDAITGEADICVEDGGQYIVPPVDNATGYQWNFEGNGAEIIGNDNAAMIHFAEREVSGLLTVAAINRCGTGQPSPPLAIRAITCELFIPNAFSPNNDGINDVFVIRNTNKDTRLIIFERSGKVVYESDDYQNDWDGTDTEGNALPTDTYWYVLSVIGFPKDIKGYIFLKR